MNVTHLKRKDRAVVLKVEVPMLLKERLRSLNIYSGAGITVLKVSLKKGSFLVQAGSARVALGREVAENITVWKK